MYTRPRMEIDLNIIRHNYEYLSAKCTPAQAACVLKNDAYGLGAAEVGEALYRAGCRIFFVAHGCEGALLRPKAPEAKIYTLQGFGEEDRGYFANHNLIPVLPTVRAVGDWFKSAPNRLSPAIQVETGLNRLGMQIEDVISIRHLPISLILSHLACADDITHELNTHQLQRFSEFRSVFPNTPFSLSASDGMFLGKDFHFDVVRLGAALYGINTAPHQTKEVKNCLKLVAPILQIKTVKSGESVGYSAAFTAEKDCKIATVSIGYADGIFRTFSPKGCFHIEMGDTIYKAPVVGRISMDNVTCDVSDIPENILDKARFMTVIDDFYDMDKFAEACGTIGYEVLNNIGHARRMIKRYVW